MSSFHNHKLLENIYICVWCIRLILWHGSSLSYDTMVTNEQINPYIFSCIEVHKMSLNEGLLLYKQK